jgi:hypothetical protein
VCGDTETFEIGSASASAIGWEGFDTVSSDFADLGSFLGPFSQNDIPMKSFVIPSSTETVNVSFDFYEIGGWDGSGDNFIVYVNGIEVDLGDFKDGDDEHSNSAYTTSGSVNEGTITIDWSYGGDGIWSSVNEIHNVKLTIKDSTIFGTPLTLKFKASTNQGVGNESAGIDNVKVSSCNV